MKNEINIFKNGKPQKLKILSRDEMLFIRPDANSNPFVAICEMTMDLAMSQIGRNFSYLSREYVQKAAMPIALKQAQDIHNAIRNSGVSKKMQQILLAKSKAELKKIEKTLVIDMNDDFSSALWNCDQLGYTLTRNYTYKNNESLVPSKDDITALKLCPPHEIETSQSLKKTAKKIISSINSQYFRSSFLLEKGDEWHIFTFDLKGEVYTQGQDNHFGHEHIHYTSSLFGNQANKDAIWQDLCEGGHFKCASIHLRVIVQSKRATKTQEYTWLDL